MSSFRLITWIAEQLDSAGFQQNPDWISMIFSILRLGGLLLWCVYIGFRLRNQNQAGHRKSYPALIVITKLYFCFSIGIVAIVAATVAGYFNSSVSQAQANAAENRLFLWVLELGFCWVLGFLVIYLWDIVILYVSRRDAEDAKVSSTRQP